MVGVGGVKGVDRANDEYNTLRQGGQRRLGVRGNYGGHPPHCFHRAGKSAQQLLAYFPCLFSSLSLSIAYIAFNMNVLSDIIL